MKKRFPSPDKDFKSAALFRWGFVGSLTFLLDYVVFVFIFKKIDSVVYANLASSSIATSLNYLAHHRWTFKSEHNYTNSGIKYLTNLFFWWIVSTAIIKILISANVDPRVAKLAPIIIIVPINFFILQKIVFNDKN